jgi:hypothetical protein
MAVNNGPGNRWFRRLQCSDVGRPKRPWPPCALWGSWAGQKRLTIGQWWIVRLFPQMRRRPRLSRLILEAEAEDHTVCCATKQSGFNAMPSVVIVSHQTHVGEKRQPYNRDRTEAPWTDQVHPP